MQTIVIVMIALSALGIFGTLALIIIFLFFGRIIRLQTKIWFLARKGYHLIEHVGTNKVRNYFYLKPDNNKFDFNTGFYLHIPETTTKTDSLVQPLPKSWKWKKLEDCNSDEEFIKLLEQVKKLNYNVDAVTLKWGIPIITYFGNNPNPINFKEPDKVYSAQVIRDVYIRLLATQQFAFMKRMITIFVLAMAGVAIAMIIAFLVIKNGGQTIANCQAMLNVTYNNYAQCLNASKVIIQNSTTVFGG